MFPSNYQILNLLRPLRLVFSIKKANILFFFNSSAISCFPFTESTAIKSSRQVSLCYKCGRRYHVKCNDVPESLHEYLQSVRGLDWKYPEFVKKCLCPSSDTLNYFLKRVVSSKNRDKCTCRLFLV